VKASGDDIRCYIDVFDDHLQVQLFRNDTYRPTGTIIVLEPSADAEDSIALTVVLRNGERLGPVTETRADWKRSVPVGPDAGKLIGTAVADAREAIRANPVT
jgi:hypothetical protein